MSPNITTYFMGDCTPLWDDVEKLDTLPHHKQAIIFHVIVLAFPFVTTALVAGLLCQVSGVVVAVSVALYFFYDFYKTTSKKLYDIGG